MRWLSHTSHYCSVLELQWCSDVATGLDWHFGSPHANHCCTDCPILCTVDLLHVFVQTLSIMTVTLIHNVFSDLPEGFCNHSAASLCVHCRYIRFTKNWNANMIISVLWTKHQLNFPDTIASTTSHVHAWGPLTYWVMTWHMSEGIHSPICLHICSVHQSLLYMGSRQHNKQQLMCYCGQWN